MFHLLPNIRYFSWAAGTKEHEPSASIRTDEGTYWVDLTQQLRGESESNIERTMAAALLSLYGGGGSLLDVGKGSVQISGYTKRQGDAAAVGCQFSRKAT